MADGAAEMLALRSAFAPPGQLRPLTMESKADTRLVMISSLRVKAEFQRSGPQPLAGMSQRFPNKAMVAWMEGGRGGGRVELAAPSPEALCAHEGVRAATGLEPQ